MIHFSAFSVYALKAINGSQLAAYMAKSGQNIDNCHRTYFELHWEAANRE